MNASAAPINSTNTQNPTACTTPSWNRNPITWPHATETISAMTQRYMLAVMRDASGVSEAIGIALNRRLMPSTESVADRNAADTAANQIAWSTINGVRYWA